MQYRIRSRGSSQIAGAIHLKWQDHTLLCASIQNLKERGIATQGDSQFPTFDHVTEDPNEAMTAGSEEYTGLSINFPHALDHVSRSCLPAIGASSVFSITIGSSSLFWFFTDWWQGSRYLVMQSATIHRSRQLCTFDFLHLGLISCWNTLTASSDRR
jgi:hypothetical protein